MCLPAISRFAAWPALALGLVAAWAGSAAAQPYEAWRRDGARIEGKQIQALYETGNAARLDGHVLYDGNPVRMLRNLALTVERSGAVVELTNGDRLPGRVVGREGPTGDPPRPARLLVALDQPATGAEIEPSTLAVAEAMVRRILVLPAEIAPYEPGRVHTSDGRSFMARNWKFTAAGMTGLVSDGVATVGFGQIRRADLARSGIAELVAEAGWLSPQQGPPLVRVTLSRGAEISFPRTMARVVEGPWLAIRPMWATETIRIRDDRVVWRMWRDANEIPLAALPASPVGPAESAKWPWRIGASVRGGELRAGEMAAPTGWGTHAPAATAFTLPAGAKRFSAWVGVDRAVGRGGCALVRVRRDSFDGPELWKSDFLQGGNAPARISPLDVAGVQRLVLVTEIGHQGRPAGADPLDIRDDVDWLLPLVELDPAQVPKPGKIIGELVPALAGFQIAPEQQDRVALRPTFGKQRWLASMLLDGEQTKPEPLLLSREVPLTLANARLFVSAAREKGSGTAKHKIGVLVDGKPVESTIISDLPTSARSQDDEVFESRQFDLARFVGGRHTIALSVSPLEEKGGRPYGILWGHASLLPLIDDLPSDLQPLRPQTSLAGLVPVKNDKKVKLATGKLNGKPLTIRGIEFSDGLGLPAGTELSYALDPSWRRFVAVIGLAEGWQGVTFEIQLDGKPHWKSTGDFDRNTPARQINIVLPEGHDVFTLRIASNGSFGGLGNAGFRTEP